MFVTEDREPLDLHSIRLLAEGAANAANVTLERLKLPEESEIVGLLRIARDYSREIVALIPDDSDG